MKARFFIAVAAAMLLGMGTHASTVDDTNYNVRFHFTEKVTNIVAGDYSKVILVPDKEEYLEPADNPGRISADKLGVSLSGKRLKIESPAGTGTLVVHLIMEGALTLSANDYAQVTIGCDGSDFQGLNISTNDYSQVTFQGLKSINRIAVYANDFSRVSLPLDEKSDTLQAKKIAIYTSDHANVDCNVPCMAKNTHLNATDFSSIHMDYCKGDVLHTKQGPNSTAKVANFNVVNTEFSYTGGYVGPDDDSDIEVDDPEFSKGSSDKERIRKHYEKYSHPDSDKNFKCSNEFNIRFLWGFHNWGSEPFNGLNGMIGANYALKTSFSSYQLEATYYPCVWSRFRMGLGLGYESDVYKFASKYVVIDEGNPRTFTAAHTDEDMHTRLVARYVTLPLSIEWNNNDDFMLGLAALPGLAVGDKYKAIYGKGSANDIVQKSNLLNPYKCDVRFYIGWRALYAFLQVPLLPVNQDMMQDLYPMKFGFAINLGD